MKQTKEHITNECVFNKKNLKSEKHECALKVMSVSCKKWQWIDRKKQYGYVNTRKTKKYVCVRTIGKQPDMEFSQVQPRASDDVGGGIQSTEFNEDENYFTGLKQLSVTCRV